MSGDLPLNTNKKLVLLDTSRKGDKFEVLGYDAKTGVTKATVGGKEYPSLVAADLSLMKGRIGLGSFFETAQFRKLRVTAK